MNVNLINSNDIEVEQTGNDIKLNASTGITDKITNIQNQITPLQNDVELLKGTVLYNNTSGANSITLSETSENFEYLEIFWRDSDKFYGNTKVYSPNGKSFTLTSGAVPTGTIYAKWGIFKISGTSINGAASNQAGLTTNSVSVSRENFYFIVRVVGYKEV